MSRDEEAPDPRLFDRRIVERNIKRGLTTRKDYEKYLKSLPDVAANVKSPDETPDANAVSADDHEPPPPATPVPGAA